MPGQARKAGSFLALSQNLESRIERKNPVQLSAEKNSDLIELESNAGGIVGASLYSFGRGRPTASAGFAGCCAKAARNSHSNSSSSISGLTLGLGFSTSLLSATGLPASDVRRG